MAEVACLYCGARIRDDFAVCPHCGARSHFQTQGWRPGARRRFLVLFLTVAVLCLLLALWLPR